MIGATITGGVSSVTKGDTGESAYEIAVRNGYTGTEQEWLASLSANATTATAAATSAQSSATAAAASANAAASSADSARSYMTAAATSAAEAQDDRQAAAASAATANTAAGTATEDAQYIAGQISGARMAADQAATSALNAQNSAGQAATSEANARISEQQASLHAVAAAGSAREAQVAAQTAANEAHDAVSASVLNAQNSANAAAASASQAAASAQTASEQATASASAAVNAALTSAQTSATQAAASATAAANSANSAAQTIADFNANTELAHTYATLAGGHANNAQASATSASDSANRAEAALGHALAPLDNYYTKPEVNTLFDNVDATTTALSTSIAANHAAITLGAANHDTLDAKVIHATDTTDGMVKLYDEPGENIDGTMTQGAIKTGIDNVQNALLAHIDWAEHKITEVYKFKGSVQYYGNLPTSGMENGDVYNIRTGNKQAGINAGDNVAWVGEKTTYEHPTATTYDPDVTYYTDAMGTTEVDTTGFEEGVTDVSAYYVEVITPGEWDKLAGIFVLGIASSAELGGVKIGSNVDIATDGTISIADGSSSTKGVLQVGSNISVSDGTISVPTATTSTKGVLQVGSNLSVANGTISLSSGNVTAALGYTPVESVEMTRNLTSGTAIGTLSINGTDYTLYCQTNTDANVTQTVTNTSSDYPILFKSTTATSTVTNGVRFGSTIKANPSTGTITATTFNGTATSIPTVAGSGNIWIS